MDEAQRRQLSEIWLSNEKKIQDSIVRISVLENEADAVYFGVIADLFKEGSGKTPVEILKWKEIYQGLEDACDECKEFTHVLGNVSFLERPFHPTTLASMVRSAVRSRRRQ